jgi:REP element-mobilizing transposase RayT
MNNKHYPQRKSPRLQEYDYSQNGAYFITICTHNRAHVFGRIENGAMVLNAIGRIVAACWDAIPKHFAGTDVDVFVVMPNHVHGIVVLPGGGAALGTVIGTYKAAVTRQIRALASVQGKIWQPRYHDHIIHNERSLQRIPEYIVNNPSRWQEDIFYTTDGRHIWRPSVQSKISRP